MGLNMKRQTHNEIRELRDLIRKVERQNFEEAIAPDTQKAIPQFSLSYVAKMFDISNPYIKSIVAENHKNYSETDPEYIPIVLSDKNIKKLEPIGIKRVYQELHKKNPKKHPDKRLGNPIVIAVASNKGGTGKSTVSVNLAYNLAQYHQRRVTVIELDAQATLNHAIGINEIDEAKSSYIFTAPKLRNEDDEEISINQDLIKQSIHMTNHVNVNFIPAVYEVSGVEFELAAEQMQEPEFEFWNVLNNRIDMLKEVVDTDVIILDCPPTLSFVVIQALMCADIALIPTLARREAFHSIDSYFTLISDTMGAIDPEKEIILKCLVNKYEDSKEQTFYLGNLIQVFGDHLIDTPIVESVEMGREDGGFNNIYERQSNSASFKRILEHFNPVGKEIDELITAIGEPAFKLGE